MELDSTLKKAKRYAFAGAFFVVAFVLYLLRGVEGYGAVAGTVLKVYVTVVCVVMIVAILLQSGKGGGLAALGGLGGDSLFGARAATPLAKATYVLGALFVFLCALMVRQPVKFGGEADAPLPPAVQTPAPEAEQPAPDATEGTGETGSESAGSEGAAQAEEEP